MMWKEWQRKKLNAAFKATQSQMQESEVCRLVESGHWCREKNVAGRQTKGKKHQREGHTTAELPGFFDIPSPHVSLE